MKYFVVAVMVIAWTQGSGQIKITSSNMPGNGDSLRYSEALPTDLPDLSVTGVNITWDFTDFGMIRQGLAEHKASYLTPYIINFGFSAVGLKIADSLGQAPMLLTDVYDFYKTSSTKYENVGMGFIPDIMKYPQSGKHTDPDEIYLFPLEYQDTFTSTFDLQITINVFGVPVGSFFRKGTRFTEVDGWGKVSTPFASNVDCIRVKAVIDSRDSIAVTSPQVNFGTDTRLVVYKWLSTTQKIPMVEISGTEVSGNFIPQYIRYRDNYRAAPTPVTAEFSASQTLIYQNDTVDFTNMSDGQNLSYKWTITPVNGWQYVKGTNSTARDVSVAFTDTGKYTVKLVAENAFFSDSVIKTDHIEVNQIAGLNTVANDLLTVVPNPASDALYVNWDGTGIVTYRLVDLNGKVLSHGVLDGGQTGAISVRNFNEGLYSIIFEAHGMISMKKFIIRH